MRQLIVLSLIIYNFSSQAQGALKESMVNSEIKLLNILTILTQNENNSFSILVKNLNSTYTDSGKDHKKPHDYVIEKTDVFSEIYFTFPKGPGEPAYPGGTLQLVSEPGIISSKNFEPKMKLKFGNPIEEKKASANNTYFRYKVPSGVLTYYYEKAGTTSVHTFEIRYTNLDHN